MIARKRFRVKSANTEKFEALFSEVGKLADKIIADHEKMATKDMTALKAKVETLGKDILMVVKKQDQLKDLAKKMSGEDENATSASGRVKELLPTADLMRASKGAETFAAAIKEFKKAFNVSAD